MLFNSFDFFFFYFIVYIAYWILNKSNLKIQNGLLLVASYFFYGWWSYKFLGLLFLSTLIDYFYGFGVASENKRRAKFFLILSVINNLGVLFLFKYFNFFTSEFSSLLGLFGIRVTPLLIDVGLPIGISFYTFHGMSYVFDIYRKVRTPVKSFVDYGLFVSFFPLLVAGPIERANHLLPQIQSKRTFDAALSISGLRLILWGLVKKVVIADSIAVYVNQGFDSYLEAGLIANIITVVGFSFQIYCDFSGYSDIAQGSANLLGFELLSNFKFPYFARDIAEFWRRWHISLSSWFRDYLYIPIGGSKNGKLLAIRNTFIIFLVSGFWHGASWNFIAWGGIHACAFLPLLVANKNRVNSGSVVAANSLVPSIREFSQMLITFTIVSFAWIFFRAPDLNSAYNFILKSVDLSFSEKGFLMKVPFNWKTIVYILPLILIDWRFRRDERVLNLSKSAILNFILYIFTALLILFYMGEARSSEFIYFQF
ncbi:MAG: MBOAT family protein [Chitinophagaceae bacterium]|nr:MBOAT family protein [Chitinophagaceae bacterium]